MIRNNLYTEHLKEIISLKKVISEVLEKLPNSDDETMEEKEISNALYMLQQYLYNAENTITYFSRECKEGYLHKLSSGRFELDDIEFTCGSPIEIYLNEDANNGVQEGWHSGRVEARNGEYYFFGASKPSLYEGMRVRIRI